MDHLPARLEEIISDFQLSEGREKVFDNGFEPDDVSNSKIHRNITVITHSRKKFITEWESSTFVIPASLGSSPTTLNVARIFCGE